MADPSLSDDDIQDAVRTYVADRKGQPLPAGLEDRAAEYAFARHAGFKLAYLAATTALIGGLAVVTIVALALHATDHSGARPAGASSSPSASPSSTLMPTTATWTIVSEAEATLNNATGADLNAVTCVTSSECWAVQGGTIERYSGTSWSAAAAPQIPYSTLYGIACAGADNCWAVGSVYNASNPLTGPGVPLIEHYTGGVWSEVAAPNSSGVLNGVTCSSADDCWAVGGPIATSSGNTFPDYWQYPPLIDHYAGGMWTAEDGLDAGGSLDGIACPSPDDCWAVGTAVFNGSFAPTIQHYSGGAWTPVTTPELLSNAGGLFSVACLSDSDCWAVGGWGTNGQIAHESNGVWSAQPFSGTLDSIACLPSGACWAVGSNGAGLPSLLIGTAPASRATTAPSESPLIEYYSGAAWVPVTSPLPTGGDGLTSVACLAGDECWAVGGSRSEALIETTYSASGPG